MKKVNKKLDVVFLLDRSGSMQNCIDDTIGGYNSYLEKQRKNKNTLITTVLFDDHYELLHNRVEIDKVRDITKEEYYTRGCTALLDAIGESITMMDKSKSEKALFVITTDGLENASHKYTKNQIKEMIEGHPNWEFIYIGANIDSYAEASQIGIRRDNIANYEQSKRGLKNLFCAIDEATTEMQKCSSIGSANWKRKLDNFIENNQE